MFIGREAELKFLEDKYSEDGGQLIILYGRRRVGKTETLREFCKGKSHIFYSCTQSPDKLQLKRFSKAILSQGIPASRYITEFEDWESAFTSVSELQGLQNKKIPVIIDEFPYMCKDNAEIPSVLQNVWDGILKDKNVMIILCGSSMSFIEKELLAKKNPLYGRATGIYKMNEMGFYDAIKFFPEYSPDEKLAVYSVLGGIPHYLRQFNPDISVEENIKRNIFTKGSILYSETDFLLHQELREPAVYNSIIEAVATGNTKLNDISQKSLVDSTSKTSVYLKNLIELGIVEREFSVDAKANERVNAKRGIYRIADNFFRFWYTFGFNNFSQLEDGDVEGVYEYLVKPELNEFISVTFEDVCRQFVKELQKRNELPFRYSEIGRWMGKTTIPDKNNPKGFRTDETEIDLLCRDKNGTKYLLGECKYKKSPFDFSEYQRLLGKFAAEKKKAKVYYALFSGAGFDEKIIKEAKGNSLLHLYDLDDIVEPTLY